jgi:hypothetical protein
VESAVTVDGNADFLMLSSLAAVIDRSEEGHHFFEITGLFGGLFRVVLIEGKVACFELFRNRLTEVLG